MISKNNLYVGFGVAAYIVSLFYLHVAFQFPFAAFYEVLFVIGVGFSAGAWLLTKNLIKPSHRALIKHEAWLLFVLVLWIVFYITYGGDLVNKAFPTAWLSDERMASLIIFVKKLFVFVLIPFAVYKLSGFRSEDFALKVAAIKFPGTNINLIFIVFSVASLLFQLFFSNGAEPIRAGQFSVLQLATGLPLCFLYLILDAGLIEEFFFRGLLQSRLSLVLKSSVGGIVVTAIIFGLVHAPGLFLRGAQSEGMEEQMPFLFWVAYTIAYMSVAGLFLGIIYNKTKNLWLVMAIHAMFDLLPNFSDFAKTWHL